MFLEAKTFKACPCAPIETQTIQGILEAATCSSLFGESSIFLSSKTLHEGVHKVNITSLARHKMQAIPMWPSAVWTPNAALSRLSMCGECLKMACFRTYSLESLKCTLDQRKDTGTLICKVADRKPSQIWHTKCTKCLMADEHVATAPRFLKLVFGISIDWIKCIIVDYIEGLKLCPDCVVFAGNLVVS